MEVLGAVECLAYRLGVLSVGRKVEVGEAYPEFSFEQLLLEKPMEVSIDSIVPNRKLLFKQLKPDYAAVKLSPEQGIVESNIDMLVSCVA